MLSISAKSVLLQKVRIKMGRIGEKICHEGTVDKVDGQSVYVRIQSASACSSCQIKGACNLSESQEKIIEVRNQEGESHPVGETVDVVMDQSSGTRAVVLAYLIPFLIVLVSLVILLSAGVKEGISALLSIFLLVPYYSILYHFRDKLKKDFGFTIQSK